MSANPRGAALARHAHLLFLLAGAVWITLASTHGDVVRRAFLNRNLQGLSFLWPLGFVLWAALALPAWWAVRRLAARCERPPQLFVSSALLAWLSAVVTSWLWVFGFPQFLWSLGVLHLGTPLLLLLAWLSFSPRLQAQDERIAALFRARPARLAVGLLSAAMSLLFASALLEGVFQLLSGRRPASANEYGTRADLVLHPYVMFAEPDVRQGGRVNLQGFYGKEAALPKPADELRIAMLGGSVVWAGKEHDSIAGHLERRLQARAATRRVRVLNFGRQSYISMQELILLERHVLPLGIDILIVFDGFNDAGVPDPGGPGYPFLYTNLKQTLETGLARAAAARLMRELRRRSALVTALGRPPSPPSTAPNPPFSIEEVSADYGRNLLQMAALGRFYGARVLLATQPFLGTKHPLTPREESLWSAQDRARRLMQLERLMDAARAAALRAGAEYWDATRVFDGVASDLYEDAAHFAARGGNPIVASHLDAELLRRGFVP